MSVFLVLNHVSFYVIITNEMKFTVTKQIFDSLQPKTTYSKYHNNTYKLQA